MFRLTQRQQQVGQIARMLGNQQTRSIGITFGTKGRALQFKIVEMNDIKDVEQLTMDINLDAKKTVGNSYVSYRILRQEKSPEFKVVYEFKDTYSMEKMERSDVYIKNLEKLKEFTIGGDVEVVDYNITRNDNIPNRSTRRRIANKYKL